MTRLIHLQQKEECSDCVLGQNSSKSSYNLLLDSDDHVIKIHVVERNVDMYYSFVLKMFLIIINNNSCELKVHSKNKCLKVSASLQTTHLCVLEILYINIKI
jgi:hypothetical protein